MRVVPSVGLSPVRSFPLARGPGPGTVSRAVSEREAGSV